MGKVGVPIAHLGDLTALFDGIDLAAMNTSMTINATAMWLLALYQVVAEQQAEAAGADPVAAVRRLTGTTQNDIIKEYLSRGTYVFPPGPSLRLSTDLVAYTATAMPKWNPINICSYHLQEAGATPVQELAFAMCTAIAVLDAVRDSGQVPPERFGEVVARISFFVNAGVRFVEEMCKMRAFVRLWDELTRTRYGVQDPAQRRFRYGVQVNSLGLTEAQPENNVQRIVLEMLAVTLSKDARARAVQLPAWNEALGLPRPWDQQWSLRIQQVLAFESDLLEYDDLFDGLAWWSRPACAELVEAARAEIDRVQAMGGAVAAVESGYLKSALVDAHARHRARIESGEDVVVGVNRFTTTEPSPLTADLDAAVQSVDPAAEESAAKAVAAWRISRDGDPSSAAEAAGRARPAPGRRRNRRQPDDGHAALRASRASRRVSGPARCARSSASTARRPESAADAAASPAVEWRRRRRAGPGRGPRCASPGTELGGRLRLLVGKPGLDGHSNGAEQVAVRARDVGFEVIYQGIRLTPEQIVAAAVAEDVHCVGLSVLSGSHLSLVPDVLARLRSAGLDDVPVDRRRDHPGGGRPDAAGRAVSPRSSHRRTSR